MDRLTQAKAFATQKHVIDNHQLYGGVLPYTHHCADVEEVLRYYWLEHHFLAGDDHPIFVAAWLYDVIEDTRTKENKVKIRTIYELFGDDVGELVEAVTSEDGPNRKIRNALTYPKIRKTGPLAVMLKLADRLSNVGYGGGAIDMYRNEYEDFKHALYSPPRDDINPVDNYLEYSIDSTIMRMWQQLDILLIGDHHDS